MLFYFSATVLHVYIYIIYVYVYAFLLGFFFFFSSINGIKVWYLLGFYGGMRENLSNISIV